MTDLPTSATGAPPLQYRHRSRHVFDEAMRRLHADPEFRARLDQGGRAPEVRATVADKTSKRMRARRRPRKGKPVIAGGIEFPSAHAAALHFGVTNKAIYESITTGRPGYHFAGEAQKVRETPSERLDAFTQQKVRSFSKEEWKNSYKRLRAGRKPRRVVIHGVEFPSIGVAARFLDISDTTVARLLKSGRPGYAYADEQRS
jgi:hypothetical protein